MLTSLNPLVGTTQSNLTQEAPSNELGRNEFLQLLVAKLENQDPLNPAQDTEFIEQLATFSSLEQLISANDNLENLALGQGSLINAQALSLLGKEALSASDGLIELRDGLPEKMVYELPEGVQNAELVIRDSAGKPVRSIELTGEPGLRHDLEWDGLDEEGNRLDDGEYSYTVTATDGSGEELPVNVFEALKIDGVKFLNGGLALLSGDRELRMDAILEFREG
ncbi:hypothetical protein ABI59_14550 [Acidobacteria bacterium Mor1]|nr:hypothetical protein ABI59_14550 [Acidobacteria bacterium Mor1]